MLRMNDIEVLDNQVIVRARQDVFKITRMLTAGELQSWIENQGVSHAAIERIQPVSSGFDVYLSTSESMSSLGLKLMIPAEIEVNTEIDCLKSKACDN